MKGPRLRHCGCHSQFQHRIISLPCWARIVLSTFPASDHLQSISPSHYLGYCLLHCGMLSLFQFSQFSCSVMSDSLRPHGLQHTRLRCPSPTPGACSDLYPSSWWCHPTILSSVVAFSSCLQSFPESGSFQMSQCFMSGGQSIGVSASASVLPMNIQDWFPLGWTDWISWQSKGLWRIFSNTSLKASSLWRSAFFMVQLLTPIHYYWKNHSFD